MAPETTELAAAALTKAKAVARHSRATVQAAGELDRLIRALEVALEGGDPTVTYAEEGEPIDPQLMEPRRLGEEHQCHANHSTQTAARRSAPPPRRPSASATSTPSG